MTKRLVKRTAGFLLGMFLILIPVSAGNLETVLLEVNEMYRLREEGNYQECISLAERMLQENPAFMEAYFNKAVSQYELKRYVQTLETLERQLEWNPENELALFNAACASALTGKPEKSLQYLKKRMELNTDTKNLIREETDLNSLRELEEFQNMLAPSVRIGGTLLWPEVPPVNVEGRIMVPMRAVFDALGAQVVWDSAARSVTGRMGKHSVKLVIDSKTAYVNEKAYGLDVPPMIVRDRTMIPVRFVGESLGADVRWNHETQTADILPRDAAGTVDDSSQGPEAVTLMTDGMWPEPYYLKDHEGLAMLLLEEDEFPLLQRMTSDAKEDYMLYWLNRYRNMIPDCDPVYVKVVCDGKAYYTGTVWKDKPGELVDFTYFQNGLPVNVVKQYRNRFNYLDYRQSNQQPSSLED